MIKKTDLLVEDSLESVTSQLDSFQIFSSEGLNAPQTMKRIKAKR